MKVIQEGGEGLSEERLKATFEKLRPEIRCIDMSVSQLLAKINVQLNQQERMREAVRGALHARAEQAELPHVPNLRRPREGLQGQEPGGLRRGPERRLE